LESGYFINNPKMHTLLQTKDSVSKLIGVNQLQHRGYPLNLWITF